MVDRIVAEGLKHAFQKKSKKGIATPKGELALIEQRLAAAEQDYRERQH